MRFGICTLSIVPCRKEPAGTSEMVTQLLFGESYDVLETGADWMRIRTSADHYECWISARQHTALSERDFQALQKNRPLYAPELVQMVHDKKSGSSFPVTLGASLRVCDIRSSGHHFEFEGQSISPTESSAAPALLATAALYMHAPYLWGGKTPFGIDCSGFVQMVYRLNGYDLPRDAYQQVEAGHPLSFVEEAEPGDLAFFDNEEGRIVHVGIVLEEQRVMHASGAVRIDRFDHYGIFNSERKGYSHHLRVIKRLLSTV